MSLTKNILIEGETPIKVFCGILVTATVITFLGMSKLIIIIMAK